MTEHPWSLIMEIERDGVEGIAFAVCCACTWLQLARLFRNSNAIHQNRIESRWLCIGCFTTLTLPESLKNHCGNKETQETFFFGSIEPVL